MARPPQPSATPNDPELTFEAALERLQTIVSELEGGELSLEESIARYEEGMKLSRRLTQQLETAERRIERLIESGNGEPPETRPMELDTRGGEAPPPSRRETQGRVGARRDDPPRGPASSTPPERDPDPSAGELPF